MLTRRYFIKSSAVVMAGFGIAPAWLARAAGPEDGKRKILISIFQRGAADGLNIVVPFFEKRYYDIRPSSGEKDLLSTEALLNQIKKINAGS